MILAGLPLPERPQGRDEAHDRGWDPASVLHDRVTPDPLDAKWQDWLDTSVRAAKHRREPTFEDERCGTRCWDCDERMCAVMGPEPRACGVTCVDCSCSCSRCIEARDEMRAETLRHIERERF